MFYERHRVCFYFGMTGALLVGAVLMILVAALLPRGSRPYWEVKKSAPRPRRPLDIPATEFLVRIPTEDYRIGPRSEPRRGDASNQPT